MRDSEKTTEVSDGEHGYDGGKKIMRRRRHLLVETLELSLAVLISGANINNGTIDPRGMWM